MKKGMSAPLMILLVLSIIIFLGVLIYSFSNFPSRPQTGQTQVPIGGTNITGCPVNCKTNIECRNCKPTRGGQIMCYNGKCSEVIITCKQTGQSCVTMDRRQGTVDENCVCQPTGGLVTPPAGTCGYKTDCPIICPDGKVAYQDCVDGKCTGTPPCLLSTQPPAGCTKDEQCGSATCAYGGTPISKCVDGKCKVEGCNQAPPTQQTTTTTQPSSNPISQAIDTASQWISNNIVTPVSNWVNNNIVTPVSNTASSISNSVSNTVNSISTAVSNAVSSASTWVSNNITTPVSNAVTSASNAVSNAVNNAVSTVSNAVNNAVSSVTNWWNSLW